MIDLYLLCADLKSKQSDFRHNSINIISEIFGFLNNPTEKTQYLIDGWKEDFYYIYGDITGNLSSNNKLDMEAILREYKISDVEDGASVTALQLLFFSIQTYFSLLTKYIMTSVLQGVCEKNRFSHEEIILGTFAKEYGILNYCYEDWYCWPVFELNKGFDKIMGKIQGNIETYHSLTSIHDFQLNNNYDFIKQIYESIIPRELRHALGEYYTPDWLAESTLKSAFASVEKDSISSISMIDPTCGSGTFLFKAIALKRKEGCNLDCILNTVFGMDINPLAVLTAKTNYLLSVLDFIDGETEITLPVYNGDIVRLSDSVKAQENVDFLNSSNPALAVRNRVLQDRAAAQSIEKMDIVIGNPPWVNWEYMPEQYRLSSQHLWHDYKLFSARGRDLSFSKEDISVLITYIAIDKLLKTHGIIAFVIRQGVFKSAQNGVGFRNFKLGDDVPVKVLKVEDLSKIPAFDNAVNSTALFFAQKGKENTYPVPYYLWEKKRGIKKCSFGAYSQLQEVMSQLSVTKQYAMPAVKDDITSLWITAEKADLESMKKLLGTNAYRARTGVFTGGANAVYWLSINSASEDFVNITNIVERAKRKAEQICADVEKTYVYPMLRGSKVKKWNVSYDTYLLCPHTAETKMWPVPQKELEITAPKTLSYLQYFKENLDERKGFAGWEKEIQQQEFHAILRVGDYTFSNYKVIWKYIASEFICAVISYVDDCSLGKKLLLPNEKIMYVSLDNETEAYYLCGILSSTIISGCVKSYMNPTSISAHVLNKLNIPAYDENNAIHREISAICKEGHGKKDITPFIEKIDRLISKLYEG